MSIKLFVFYARRHTGNNNQSAQVRAVPTEKMQQVFSEWTDEPEKAFSVCSLWWTWGCAAPSYGLMPSAAGVLQAAGPFQVLSGEERGLVQGHAPFLGQLHPKTDWWRGTELWSSHPNGAALRGGSIFRNPQKLGWGVHRNCTAARLLPLPSFASFSSVPCHRCWIPRAPPKNVLHTNLCLRVFFLGHPSCDIHEIM